MAQKENEMKVHCESEEDRREQERIRSRALYSLSVLEKSFIRRASGRYFHLLPNPDPRGR